MSEWKFVACITALVCAVVVMTICYAVYESNKLYYSAVNQCVASGGSAVPNTQGFTCIRNGSTAATK